MARVSLQLLVLEQFVMRIGVNQKREELLSLPLACNSSCRSDSQIIAHECMGGMTHAAHTGTVLLSQVPYLAYWS